MVKKSLIGMSFVMASLVSVSASAATIDFGVAAPTSGTISYAGGAAPLVGSGIEVDTIVELDILANDGIILDCDSCVLEFTSGAFTGVGTNSWDFGSGGSISIVGGVSDSGSSIIALNSTLLSGSFDSATVLDVGGGTFDFKIAGASFIDTKHPDLLSYFGMPSGNYQGGMNISFNMVGTPSLGSAFDSDSLFSGDIVNSPIVPIPAAVWLFGTGLLGLVGVARRRV